MTGTRAASEAQATDAARIPIYVDCDPGIDDALAIALLLRSERVSVVGVGSVAGNVGAEAGARNAEGVLDLAGRSDIGVGVGAARPLRGQFGGGFPGFHGSDGLGNVRLPVTRRTGDRLQAVDQLVSLARSYEGRLRIVAVGPLTNLALALQLEPEIAVLVNQVYVMGGAVGVSGNVTPFAEANLWSDPEAADEVLRSDLPVTLVPLDVTMKHRLTRADIDLLGCSSTPLLRALSEMLTFYGKCYEAELGDVLTPLHDPLTAALAADMVSITEETTVRLRVETSGKARGALILGSENTRPVRLVCAVDESAASIILQNVLEGGRVRA